MVQLHRLADSLSTTTSLTKLNQAPWGKSIFPWIVQLEQESWHNQSKLLSVNTTPESFNWSQFCSTEYTTHPPSLQLLLSRNNKTIFVHPEKWLFHVPEQCWLLLTKGDNSLPKYWFAASDYIPINQKVSISAISNAVLSLLSSPLQVLA